MKSIRLTHADADLLRCLSKEWGCSEAAAVRRLVREKAACERSTGLGERSVTTISLCGTNESEHE